MLSKSGRRGLRSRSRAAAALLALTLAATLTSVVGLNPASAADKMVSLGDTATFDDGSAASGVKVDLFEAVDEFNRGAWLGPAFTDSNGNYSFSVAERSCHILVGIAPLGSEFGGVGSGEVYDQRYACTTDAPNLDVDFVLFRQSVKPPPTTAPPTTVPPTTAPPTTAPPTTAPPTTAPPTTVPPTTAPPTTVPPTTAPPTTTAVCPTPTGDAAILFRWEGSDVVTVTYSYYPDDLPVAFRDGILDLQPVIDHIESVVLVNVINVSEGIGDDGRRTIKITADNFVQMENMPPLSVLYPAFFEFRSGSGPKAERVCIPFKVRNLSPIGLDVDGSGSVERIGAEVVFDFAGNGEAVTATEWFAPTEGILFDTRIEGPITGAHLFGDQNGTYADGFEKLALLDANADGQVAGAELDGLAIWTDVNTNGQLDAGEQTSLADHGIVSLSTSHTNMISVAALADGSTMMTEDLWFPVAGAAVSTNTTSLVLFAIAGLGLVGYALVASRRRRDSLDAELAALLEDTHAS